MGMAHMLGVPGARPELVEADPVAAARGAVARLGERCDRLLVHFDVDVVDFTDTPLSENWGRNEGLAFKTALTALGALLAAPELAAPTITELNPDHTEPGGGAIERLVEALAEALRAPVPVREELVATGWPLRAEERKRWAGSA